MSRVHTLADIAEETEYYRGEEVDQLIDNCQLILQEKTNNIIRYKAEKEALEDVADKLFNKLEEAEKKLKEKDHSLQQLRSREFKISNPGKAVADIKDYIAMSDKDIEKEKEKMKKSVAKKYAKRYGL